MGTSSSVTAGPWTGPSTKRHWVHDNEPINHSIKLSYHGWPLTGESCFSFPGIQEIHELSRNSETAVSRAGWLRSWAEARPGP